MSDKVSDFVNSSDMEQAVVEKAQEVFLDAWDLAVETQDEELFTRVWDESLRLVIDDILASLIEKGLVEAAGMTPDGDMSFCLSPAGHEEVQNLER